MADASKGKGKGQANNNKGQQAPAKAAANNAAQPTNNNQAPKDQNKNQPPQKQTQPNKQQNQNQPPVKETKKQEQVVQSPPAQEQKQATTEQKVETPVTVAQVDQNATAEKKKPAKPQREYERGRGVVKAVLSGDLLLVIAVDKSGGVPQEKEVQITNISAPKLGKRNKDGKRETDEEYAFGSREYLRKVAIGKQVSYTIENKGKSTGKTPREYAVVFVIGRDGKETDLAQLMVSEGWARVRRREPKEGQTAGPLRSDVEELMKMEEEAKRAERGLHAKDAKAKKNSIRPIVDYSPSELYEKSKNAPQHGVVERCLTGSTIIVTLLPSFTEIKILLSGVECPGQNQSGEFEPWGREAKFCTEHFLLNRDVQVILEGADKVNLFGTLDLGGNNISEELLKRGLARYVDWSGSRTAFVDRLRAAEKAAKDKKAGIWGAYVEPKALTKQEENDRKIYKSGREIQGRVTQIINGGLIIVTDNSNVQHEISLSSIILPKGGNMRPKEKQEEGKEEVKVTVGDSAPEKSAETKGKESKEREEALERTLAWEAKEYVRRRLIGQKVRCVYDYTQTPGTPGQTQSGRSNQNKNDEPRNYFSVYLDKNNIAVELTAAGLAQPRNHRGGEQRSKDYEDILKAETLALKSNRGRYVPDGKKSVLYINDVSGNPEKARKFLPSLKRGKNRGVVVHVLNAGKLRIYVPRESSEITFSLSGLKTPRMEEAFNAESTTFTKERLSQREVEFEVTAVDRGGNFVGNLWGPNRENLAASLLEAGYASLIRGIAKELENYTQLDEAENRAKKNKKNIWVNYNEQEENEKKEKAIAQRNAEKAQTSSKSREQEFVDVVVTEIIDASRFYVQIVGEEAAKLEELMANLATDDTTTEDFKPKYKDFVKAQYSDDNNWYRAQITGEDNGNYTVFYIDYGNSETLPASAIKPLAAKFKVDVLKAQAVEAKLAFLKVPTLDEDYGTEAAEFLKEMVESKTMMANVEYKDSTNVLYLSLGDRESNVHVNAAMVRNGLARVKKPKGEYLTKSRQAVDQLLTKLREEENTARKSHSCIWEYGDPGSDDDDDRDIKAIEAKKKAAAATAAKGKGSPAVGKKD